MLNLIMLSVPEEYSNMGIATQLVDKSISVAKEMNIPLVGSSLSNAYSQKIAAKFGLETVSEIKYEGVYSNYENMPKEIRDVHKSCRVMAKKLID